jgi:site-specific DNA recombinase
MNRKKESIVASPKQIRCAIYTRKSTEEGLEQEFNSLDAQRDAGEAYIKSQQHEGWTCLPTHYDDGGFTGANLDRPALKRLLTDIEAGKIDSVIVYKVDRLSRSLLDFGRLLETFEKHKVAFVSVTQAFNTSSSMGRLTLNVLLSFAQFEREMISERTRDKIAAARRKGKWSGGMPVLGYTVVNTKLVVDPAEAEQVRQIFTMYVERRSLLAVVKELNTRDWRTKRWTTKKGEARGGRVFGKNSLYQLLTNVAYAGKVRYKDEVHSGEHEAIIEPAVFEQIQTLLSRNSQDGGREVRNKHGALLRGLLHCAACNCGMSHSFTSKGTRQYRYYTCQNAQSRGWDACPSPSVPAGEIERFVVDEIKCIGRDPGIITEIMAQVRLQLEEQIDRLKAERSGLWQRLRDDHALLGRLASTAPPGDPRLADAHDRIREAERRVSEVDSDLATLQRNVLDDDEVAAALRDFDAVWDCLTSAEQVRVIELLVERVVYDGADESIAITFRPSGIRALGGQLAGRKEEAA